MGDPAPAAKVARATTMRGCGKRSEIHKMNPSAIDITYNDCSQGFVVKQKLGQLAIASRREWCVLYRILTQSIAYLNAMF